jgi:hypothetical protein
MKFVPKFSWLALRHGQKLLNAPRKHNKFSPPKIENPPLFLSLDPPILLLLLLLSRSKN